MNTMPNAYKYSDENLPRTQQIQKERNINIGNEKRKKLFKTTGADKIKLNSPMNNLFSNIKVESIKAVDKKKEIPRVPIPSQDNVSKNKVKVPVVNYKAKPHFIVSKKDEFKKQLNQKNKIFGIVEGIQTETCDPMNQVLIKKKEGNKKLYNKNNPVFKIITQNRFKENKMELGVNLLIKENRQSHKLIAEELHQSMNKKIQSYQRFLIKERNEKIKRIKEEAQIGIKRAREDADIKLKIFKEGIKKELELKLSNLKEEQ